MKWILSLFLCVTASAQLPVIPYPVPSGAARFLPTSPTNVLALWGELTPTNGTFGDPNGLTVPANNAQDVKYWTNLSSFISGSRWTADQALHPTNYVSGGGGGGTSPRLEFHGNSSMRMVGPTIPDLTNKFTVVMVANCTSAVLCNVIFDGLTGNDWLHYNTHKLEISQGTTLSSAATMTSGYYVITVVFASDATSHIDTNGVVMVTGNAGSSNLRAPYLAQGGTTSTDIVNICRLWGWYGVLNATDLAKAVAQCRTDFGI